MRAEPKDMARCPLLERPALSWNLPGPVEAIAQGLVLTCKNRCVYWITQALSCTLPSLVKNPGLACKCRCKDVVILQGKGWGKQGPYAPSGQGWMSRVMQGICPYDRRV